MLQEGPLTVLRIPRDRPNSSPAHLELQMIICYQFLGSQNREWVWQTYYHAIYSKAFLNPHSSKVALFKIMMHSKVCLYISSFLIFQHFFHLYSPVFIHVLPLLSLKSVPRESEVKSLSCVQLFATPWTIQSMELSRSVYWSRKPFPSPGDLLIHIKLANH